VLRIAREGRWPWSQKSAPSANEKEKTPELNTEEEDDDSDNSFDVFSLEPATRSQRAVLSHVLV
jgi:hypothetical protein